MIKENINKIDYDLKNLFEDVKILEKSNKGNYYLEIGASCIFESNNEKKKGEVKVEISKPNLNSNTIKWSYYTNPVNESSDKIERISNIESIASDIYDIISSKKMANDYFESLSPIIELINESSTDTKDKTIEDKINDILSKFEIKEKIIEEKKFALDGSIPEKILVYSKKLTILDKILLESELKSVGVEYISFSNDNIKIML